MYQCHERRRWFLRSERSHGARGESWCLPTNFGRHRSYRIHYFRLRRDAHPEKGAAVKSCKNTFLSQEKVKNAERYKEIRAATYTARNNASNSSTFLRNQQILKEHIAFGLRIFFYILDSLVSSWLMRLMTTHPLNCRNNTANRDLVELNILNNCYCLRKFNSPLFKYLLCSHPPAS